MLHDVQRRVRAGSSISEAFEAQGSLISNVYIASLKAGEKSRDLERVIRRYIKHTKIINLVRKKTASALVYPAVLMGLCSVVVGIMVFRVVPQFADFLPKLKLEITIHDSSGHQLFNYSKNVSTNNVFGRRASCNWSMVME